MEEEFGKIMENLIKQEDTDVEETKKYIIIIKKYLDHVIGNCKDELTKEECLEEFLEEYKKELKNDTFDFTKMRYKMFEYNSFKELAKIVKGDKVKLKKIINEAREREKRKPKEPLMISLEFEEQLINAMRKITRDCPKLSEKELLMEIQARKSFVGENLKNDFIDSIQNNVIFLNQYGILDQYIEEANKDLKDLNLEGLTLRKRNPLPDEIGVGNGNFIKYDKNGKFCKYDEKGNVVKDGEDLDKYEEDIGVLDTFDEEYLKKLSPEDLLMMDTFFRAKYWEERIGLYNAMSTIKFLDLWPTILNESEEKIEKLDDKLLCDASKREAALRYLWRNEENITLKMRRQYSKFLKNANMQKRGKIKDEINEQKEELEHISFTANMVALEECMIVKGLKDKEFTVKDWGTLEFEKQENEDVENDNEVVVAIENANFRGALIIAIHKKALNAFCKEEELKLPKYKNSDKINDKYSKIMAKLFLPTNNYFNIYIKKKYDENPSSELFANLAGKKVRKKEEQGREF